MSSAPTPIATAFELQRRSIEFGERLFEQGLALQRDATETAMRNGFAAQREAQEQGLELARRLFHAQADAVQATVNGDEFRAIADRQFEALGEDQAVAMDEFEAAFVDAFGELTERQRELFVESIESALDAHADVERQAVQGAGRTRDVARTAQQQTEQMAAQTTAAAEQGMNATEQSVATAQRGAGAAQQGVDSARQQAAGAQQSGRMQQQASAAPQRSGGTTQSAETGQQQAPAGEPPAAELEEIEGLGPTYAERLYDGGIQSVPDLANAEAEVVAEIADAAEATAEEWIETARAWN